ncbi:hypothetical protein QUC31_014110 [Theobroma cacao]
MPFSVRRSLSPNRAFLCQDQRLFAALLRASLTFPKSLFLCRDQRLFAALLRASLNFPKSSLLVPRPEAVCCLSPCVAHFPQISLLVPRPKAVCCPSPCVAHFPQIEPSCAETRGCLLPFFVRRSLSPNLFCCEVLNADEIRQIQGCLSTQAFLWFVVIDNGV